MDPPFAWNCQVVAGAGVVEDVQQLYSDMHSYLAGLHLTVSHVRLHPVTFMTMSALKIFERVSPKTLHVMRKGIGHWLRL